MGMLTFCNTLLCGSQRRSILSKGEREYTSCSTSTCSRNQLAISAMYPQNSNTAIVDKQKTFPNYDARLILAPMEVLADHHFRTAITPIGGMDEAVHEFIRITKADRSHIRGVLRNKYDVNEMGKIPLAAQIMGGDANAMALATEELATKYGAHRIDLNCGCPSHRVNGHGAGASLLQTPEKILKIVQSMVNVAREGPNNVIISVKMRSGYDSVSLFEENVSAIKEGGAKMITVHPRTKTQAYNGKADWDMIRIAKNVCGTDVEVVGNGDITNANDAVQMLELTGCDHVMVGRGAVANPWIFWEIRQMLDKCAENKGTISRHRESLKCHVKRCLEMDKKFFLEYLDAGGGVDDHSKPKVHRTKIGRLKMMLRYNDRIEASDKKKLLSINGNDNARIFVKEILKSLERYYEIKQETI